MRNFIHRHLLPTALAAGIALGLAPTASADELPDTYGRMRVENIWVTPAQTGGYSTLHFRIVNDSHDEAHLMAVETPVAAKTRIVGRVSDHKSVAIESLGVRADSDVNVGSDHTWIELGPLTREMRPGETIPVEFVFARRRVSGRAHVHSADG